MQEVFQRIEVIQSEQDYKLTTLIKQQEIHSQLFDRVSTSQAAGPTQQNQLLVDQQTQMTYLRDQVRDQ